MIIPQKRAVRGSQKWIQDIANACPDLLNNHIHNDILSISGCNIEWKSPSIKNDFAEYRDADFLGEIGLTELTEKLKLFWPKNGPQWDALGKTSDNKAFFLVEAKANVPEIVSSCGAKDKESLKTISGRPDETQRWLNCQKPLIDWKSVFYQYANRLAHLKFLKEMGKEAYLIFVYFIGDPTRIPTSRDAWNSALELQKKLMGLSARSLRHKGIIDVFINTADIVEL